MFRNIRIKARRAIPHSVNHTVMKSEIRNGVTFCSACKVPVDGSGIPDPDKYRLHDLIDANIPLNRVSADIVGSVPTEQQALNIASHIVESDKTE